MSEGKVLQNFFKSELEKDIKDRCESGCRREKFISRLFGIFNEEIVKIWCENENSPYRNDGRPTIYTDKQHYTLDFTFIDKKGNKYIVEMKSELQYRKFKYMVLSSEKTEVNYFENHKKKEAFWLFLNPGEKTIKVEGDEIEAAGSILIWGSIAKGFKKGEFCERMSEENGIDIDLYDILSVENMIDDLIGWQDKNYIDFIEEYKQWSEEFFSSLIGKGQEKI